MKKLILAFLFLGLSCSFQPINPQTRTQSSVYKISAVDFTDPQNQIVSLTEIENIFLNSEKQISAAELNEKLTVLTKDIPYRTLMFTYTEQLTKVLQLSDIYDWSEKNPDASRALHNYIDPQEPDENGEPIWQTTNRNLRNSNRLSPAQNAFATRMNAALDSLPPAKAIVYRGVYLKTADFEKYKNAKERTELSFVSTSLDPNIALGFSTSGKGDVATVFVIDSYSGRPISFVVPTNMHEMEILFKTDTSFDVVRVVQSKDLKTGFIFLREKP